MSISCERVLAPSPDGVTVHRAKFPFANPYQVISPRPCVNDVTHGAVREPHRGPNPARVPSPPPPAPAPELPPRLWVTPHYPECTLEALPLKIKRQHAHLLKIRAKTELRTGTCRLVLKRDCERHPGSRGQRPGGRGMGKRRTFTGGRVCLPSPQPCGPLLNAGLSGKRPGAEGLHHTAPACQTQALVLGKRMHFLFKNYK